MISTCLSHRRIAAATLILGAAFLLTPSDAQVWVDNSNFWNDGNTGYNWLVGGGSSGAYGCPDISPSWWEPCSSFLWRGECNNWRMYQMNSYPGSYCAASCARCPNYRPPTQVAVTTVRTVTFTVLLTGISEQEFRSVNPATGQLRQTEYRRAIADLAGVSFEMVVITNIFPGPGGIYVTTQVAFYSNMANFEQNVNNFQTQVSQMGGQLGGRKLLQDSFMSALQSAGFTVGNEQPKLDVQAADAAIPIPVTEGQTVDSVASDPALIGAQLQQAAEKDMTLKTPEDLGISFGQTSTIDVPQDVQNQVGDVLQQEKTNAEQKVADAPASVEASGQGSLFTAPDGSALPAETSDSGGAGAITDPSSNVGPGATGVLPGGVGGGADATSAGGGLDLASLVGGGGAGSTAEESNGGGDETSILGAGTNAGTNGQEGLFGNGGIGSNPQGTDGQEGFFGNGGIGSNPQGDTQDPLSTAIGTASTGAQSGGLAAGSAGDEGGVGGEQGNLQNALQEGGFNLGGLSGNQ